MSIDSGRFRHLLRIEDYVEVLDSAGEPVRGPQGEFVREWADVFPDEEIWGEIAPLSVREFIQSAAMQSQISARIVIWYRPNLHANMRIVDATNGRTYNPAGFLPDKVSGLEYLTIPVSEGVNDGQ